MSASAAQSPVTSATGVLAAVRAATRALHENIEGRLVLSRADAGRAEYCAYARALLAWLEPFEAELWRAEWPADVDAASRDGKCAWLREDLAALHASPLTAKAPAPDLTSPAARYGVAYVIEGSQLGGNVLARRLQPSLAPHVPRYLVGYGADLGARWRGFVSSFEQHVTSPADIEAAAQSARRTFASLSDWFATHGAA